jgi:hypothetical protein
MKKYLLAATLLLAIVLFSSSFKTNKSTNPHHFRSGGAATNFDDGYLGAPGFAPSTCGICHSGGGYAPSINVELLNGSNIPVASYMPGASYNLRISIVPTSGSPKFGFQTTCVEASTNNNIDNWGAAMPTNVNNILVSGGRNYVEHNARLASGIITIPWTAPAVSFGAVKFYAIGNAVNSDFTSGGDNPTNSFALTINEGVLPITLSSFYAKQSADVINLYWRTSQEVNNDYFLVERSYNNIDFSAIGKIKGIGNSSNENNYTFDDKNAMAGKNYYRLAQTDFDGKVKYSSVVTINNKNIFSSVTISPNPVVDKIILKSNFTLIGNKYTVVNNVGLPVLSGILMGNEIDIQKLPSGTYFIRIQQKDNNIISQQFIK